MTLQTLPAEILLAICSQCHKFDIPTLRLTCRAINKAASGFLIPDISAFFHRPCLERLLTVANLPTAVRKCATTLLFRLDAYQPWRGIGTWDGEETWDQRRTEAFLKSRHTITTLLEQPLDSEHWLSLSNDPKERLREFHDDNEDAMDVWRMNWSEATDLLVMELRKADRITKEARESAYQWCYGLLPHLEGALIRH